MYFRIRAEKELPHAEINRIIARTERLIDYLQHSYAVIAYNKMNGEFCLQTVTLKDYKKAFGRVFDFERMSKGQMVFWCKERGMWLNLHLANFLEWRAVQ